MAFHSLVFSFGLCYGRTKTELLPWKAFKKLAWQSRVLKECFAGVNSQRAAQLLRAVWDACLTFGGGVLFVCVLFSPSKLLL